MISGLTAWPTAGAARVPMPRFSVAVIEYGCDLPVRRPCGVLMPHWKSFLAAFHLQLAAAGWMPGPWRVTCSMPALARAAAMLGAIAVPAESDSRNAGVTVGADLLSVAFGLGEEKPGNP